MTVNVKWHPQYDRGKIVRYSIYAWVANPLLGEVIGSRRYTDTERKAKKIAREMRKMFSRAQAMQS